MKLILLYGLTATGKSSFCDYVANLYNYRIIHVRRMFESVVGKDRAPVVYHQLLTKTKSRCTWLNLISEDILKNLDNQQVVIIEGLFTIEESIWFKKQSDVIIVYLENNREKERIVRFCERERLLLSLGELKMKNSDIGRIEAGVLSVRSFADYIINNDSSLENFYKAIDLFIEQI